MRQVPPKAPVEGMDEIKRIPFGVFQDHLRLADRHEPFLDEGRHLLPHSRDRALDSVGMALFEMPLPHERLESGCRLGSWDML